VSEPRLVAVALGVTMTVFGWIGLATVPSVMF